MHQGRFTRLGGPHPARSLSGLNTSEWWRASLVSFAIWLATGCHSVEAQDCPNPFGAALMFPAGSNSIAIVQGDFNGDGKTDLAATNDNSGNISILPGNQPLRICFLTLHSYAFRPAIKGA